MFDAQGVTFVGRAGARADGTPPSSRGMILSRGPAAIAMPGFRRPLLLFVPPGPAVSHGAGAP